MCGRYLITSAPEAFRRLFGYPEQPNFPPRYNVAPTQPIPVVRVMEERRQFALVRWGLIPPWVEDPRRFSLLINARADSVNEKPAFRNAMRRRRCLVPADGFYEWTGSVGARRPHLARLRGGRPMGIAGIFEQWLGADGSEFETLAILTVAANRAMSALHDRMPAILAPEHFDAWLDCRPGTADGVVGLLQSAPEDLLDILEVSGKVNNPRNEGPEVQEPAGQASLF
jgi:putative SOS response-associated peptidase YedK